MQTKSSLIKKKKTLSFAPKKSMMLKIDNFYCSKNIMKTQLNNLILWEWITRMAILIWNRDSLKIKSKLKWGIWTTLEPKLWITQPIGRGQGPLFHWSWIQFIKVAILKEKSLKLLGRRLETYPMKDKTLNQLLIITSQFQTIKRKIMSFHTKGIKIEIMNLSTRELVKMTFLANILKIYHLKR